MNILEEPRWIDVFNSVWRDEQERNKPSGQGFPQMSLDKGTVNEETVVKRVKKIFKLLKESE